MDELKKNLATVAASLQVLAANTTANTEDLKEATKRMEAMERRSKSTAEAVQSLQGTFASIETHLVKLFELDAELRDAWKDLARRVDALEKKQPPAA